MNIDAATQGVAWRGPHPGAGSGVEDPPCSGPGGTVWVVAPMAALVVLTLAGELGSDAPPWLLVFDVVLGVVGCLAMPVTRRRPLEGALALGATAALSPAMTPLTGAALLWLAQCRPLPVAVGAAGVSVVAQVLRGLWRPVALPLGWWFALFVALYAAVVGWGAMVQARRAVIASLRERARRAEAEQARRVDEARRAERTRIAREMHDVLAHRLSLLATSAGALEYRPDAPPDQLARAAGVVREGAHRALDELREVIGLLRDDVAGTSDDTDQRPQPTLTDLPRLVEESRAAGMRVRVDDRVVDPSAVPAATGRTLYRVVQEALTNARRHAGGQPVRLALCGAAGGDLTVDVRNPLPDGPSSSAAAPGNGLIGLAERVRLAGGHLEHEVTPDGEFHLRATLPWPHHLW